MPARPPSVDYVTHVWGQSMTAAELGRARGDLRSIVGPGDGEMLGRLGAAADAPRSGIPFGITPSPHPGFELELIVPMDLLGHVSCPMERTGSELGKRLVAEVGELAAPGACAFAILLGRRGDRALSVLRAFYLDWTVPRAIAGRVADIIEPEFRIGEIASEASPFYWWCRGLMSPPAV